MEDISMMAVPMCEIADSVHKILIPYFYFFKFKKIGLLHI